MIVYVEDESLKNEILAVRPQKTGVNTVLKALEEPIHKIIDVIKIALENNRYKKLAIISRL